MVAGGWGGRRGVVVIHMYISQHKHQRPLGGRPKFFIFLFEGGTPWNNLSLKVYRFSLQQIFHLGGHTYTHTHTQTVKTVKTVKTTVKKVKTVKTVKKVKMVQMVQMVKTVKTVGNDGKDGKDGKVQRW
jgi:hypothetical protein